MLAQSGYSALSEQFWNSFWPLLPNRYGEQNDLDTLCPHSAAIATLKSLPGALADGGDWGFSKSWFAITRKMDSSLIQHHDWIRFSGLKGVFQLVPVTWTGKIRDLEGKCHSSPGTRIESVDATRVPVDPSLAYSPKTHTLKVIDVENEAWKYCRYGTKVQY